MTADELRAVINFESSLTIGSPVMACWTSCGYSFRVPATIERINTKTYQVRTSEAVMHRGKLTYPAGFLIKLPRIDDLKRWSANNRAEPLTGYVVPR